MFIDCDFFEFHKRNVAVAEVVRAQDKDVIRPFSGSLNKKLSRLDMLVKSNQVDL